MKPTHSKRWLQKSKWIGSNIVRLPGSHTKRISFVRNSQTNKLLSNVLKNRMSFWFDWDDRRWAELIIIIEINVTCAASPTKPPYSDFLFFSIICNSLKIHFRITHTRTPHYWHRIDFVNIYRFNSVFSCIFDSLKDTFLPFETLKA